MYQKEMKDVLEKNVMDYAKYTITDRAIVSLSDGMKNIHRRIIWSMYLDGLLYNKDRTKSVNAVGSVLRFSPHGDASVYQACVRLANDSVMYPLIDGKGSFSSITSRDVQAGASRYTEMRLHAITQEIIKDINKNVVDMVNNYDDTRLEPVEMPVTFPLILANPNLGIAVGIASNICSFNLNDIIDNTINVLRNQETFTMIPDFPTKGLILYNEKILNQIRNNGTGTIYLRAKYHIEENSIVITEIPYTTTKEAIIESVINLIKNNKLKEVADINDYSGVKGLNITIDVRKNTNIDTLMKRLYKSTPLQSSFGCNFTMLVDNKPYTLGTDDILKEWTKFRINCVTRGLMYDLEKKNSELHFLKGLSKILLDIDKTIDIIRKSENETVATNNLIEYFKIDEKQAEYIASIKLININKNYILKKIKDIEILEKEISEINTILSSEEKVKDIIINQLEEVKRKYAKPRQTQVIYEDELQEISADQLIEQYNCKLIYTRDSYLKKLLKSSDQQKLKDNDEIIGEISSTNKSTLLFFTNKQNRYRLPCHQLDTCTPSALGTYIPNILNLEPNEQVIKVFSIDEERGYILSVFANGKLSKIDIKSYMSNYTKLNNCYSNDSELIDINYIEKDIDVLLLTEEGKSLIINSSQIGSKQTRGSQGNMAINTDSKVIAAIIDVNKEMKFTIETEKGKKIDFTLSDIAPTGKSDETRTLFEYIYGNVRNKGNYIYYNKTDKIISFTLNK